MDGTVHLQLKRVQGFDDRLEVLAEPDRSLQEDQEVHVAILAGLIPCLRTEEQHSAEAILERGLQPRPDLCPDLVAQHGAPYSTVTLFARFRGWSTSAPLRTPMK